MRRRAEPAPATPAPASAAGPAGASANGAATALWCALAALVLARLALAFVPSMWLWGLNLQRFLAPPVAWGLWAIAALALVPPLARALTPALARLGDLLLRPVGAVAGELGAALLIFALPDQVRFVGDFLLRQGTVEQAGRPGVLFPQALPLDVLLHYQLPSAVVSAGVLNANGAARALGAIEAALLATMAFGFARGLALHGIAALAVAAVAFWGGTLCMFTGYSKAFAEMTLLVAAAGVYGLRVVREGRGLLPLALVFAAGLALHRSALGLIPAVALAFVWGWRAPGRAAPEAARGDGARGQGARQGGRARAPSRAPRRAPVRVPPRFAWIAALLVALAGLAAMLPRIVATMLEWDAVHLVPHEVRAQGGMLRAAFAGTRPADMLGLVIALSPLALAAPALALLLRRSPGRGREIALLVTLAAPFVLTVPFIHPAQGLYRDWDDFAAGGQALSLITAWLVGETLRKAPARAWLGVPVALGVAGFSLQWLVHFNDLDRGLTRVEAFMTEPPQRLDGERGKTWDYLGIRNFRLQRWDAAARAFGFAAETSPSPRILLEWGTAELRRRNYGAARDQFRRVIAAIPDEANAWSGLAAAAIELGDRQEARRAAENLLRLRPGDPVARRTLERLGSAP